MTSEWQCSACSSTFSRPEHLKRHIAASRTFRSAFGQMEWLIQADDRVRPHICPHCGNAFNRKYGLFQMGHDDYWRIHANISHRDVLRRHERTCPSRASTVTEENTSNDEVSDDRCVKRHRPSLDTTSNVDFPQGQVQFAQQPSDPTINDIDSESPVHSLSGMSFNKTLIACASAHSLQVAQKISV